MGKKVNSTTPLGHVGRYRQLAWSAGVGSKVKLGSSMCRGGKGGEKTL